MRKTAEDQKRELVDELAVARRSLLETVGALPPERLDEVFLGTWSVKDLLVTWWDGIPLTCRRSRKSWPGNTPHFSIF
jgi:hypothetical protein